MPTPQQLIADEAGGRLDLWLHKRFPDCSRSTLQRLIREGHVLLHGKPCSAKASVGIGDTIAVEFPDPRPATLEPEDMNLEILHEDAHLLVLNKPAGLVVHPGAGHAEHTLVNALLHHCRGKLSGIGGEERPGIVHRLDKDTSGCLVVAKSDRAHRALVEMFQTRAMEKTYLALVWGAPRMPSGKIEKPIGRHRVHRHKMTVSDRGREALTEWKVRERAGPVTWIECRIHTGRTHQIRVHMASIGHPVVGDGLYGRTRVKEDDGNPSTSDVAARAQRQMLHAWRLAFDHPVTGKRIECEAPLPKDMRGCGELKAEV